MEVKKAIKKVVALGIGAAMVGTTIMGAMAASLADYPKPFVQDGKFNGYIVLGDNAKVEDVIGSTDIISSLQSQMVVTKTVSTGTGSSTVTVSGDSWKAETSTKKLEIGTVMNTIQSKLTSSDLKALADGTVKAKNSADYEQEIALSPGFSLAYEEETNTDTVGDFLKITNSQEILNYSLTFKTPSESKIVSGALDDLQDSSITMLGKDYIVTDTALSGKALTLTLMGGSVNDILEEGQTKTYTVNGKDYEVTAGYIGTSDVKMTVNGVVSKTLGKGDTETLSGIDIGIRDVLAENLAGETDKVEFYLGAAKMQLYDSDITSTATMGTMEIGTDSMDYVNVNLVGSNTSSTFDLDSINLQYKSDDNLWIAKGKKLSDYASQPESFLNWDVSYEGLNSATIDPIELSSSGNDRIVLKATVADGTVEIPLAYAQQSKLRTGDSNYNLVLNYSNKIQKNDYFILTTGSATDVNDKSYVMEYKGATSALTDSSATLKFKNLATDETIERSMTIGSTATLNIGGTEFIIANTSSAAAGTHDFNISITSGGAAVNLATPKLVTKGGAKIVISALNGANTSWADATDDIQLVISEVDPSNQVNSKTETDAKVLIGSSVASDYQVTIDKTNLSMIADPTDSDVQTAMTKYGALFKYTQIDSAPDKVEISWPEAQLVGQAFVISGATTSSASTAGGTVETQEIVKIDVGATIRASEIAGEETSHNLILVGGPCANAAASVIMGNPENCAAGFEAGKAKIKLYTNANGKVALLVAGDQAMDTQGACRYLANNDKNAAMFAKATDEIALTVTSLSSITASIPTQ